MTQEPLPPALVIPLHWAVAGRVRVHVGGLRRNQPAIDRFVASLRHDRLIVTVKVGFVTGNALIRYRDDIELSDILDRLAQAVQGRRPAGEADETPWHTVPAEAAAALLHTDPERGLAAADARRRLAAHGPNRLSLPRRRKFGAILAGQFASLPVVLLAGSAIMSLVTGGAFEAVAILVVVAANGVIGAVSEAQAEHMIARLESQRRRTALVRRGGRVLVIDAELVVPGDVIELSPGHVIPADARLTESRTLAVDESILTGESLPVVKSAPIALPEACPLADRQNMVWRGTLVGGGQGRAVVVATGRDTEVGRIQTLIGDIGAPQTPLQNKLNRLGRHMVLGSVALCLLVVALGVARGFALAELLRTVFALGVAAIPEGLPTVATLSLAQAVGGLKRKGVLVRRLEAVETLGVVSTVFFDKTGTLTLNHMSVAEVMADGEGKAERLWRTAALCSDATVDLAPDLSWQVDGSSTEAALVRAALDRGVDVRSLRRAWPRLAERYRDDRRQSMATVHDMGGRRHFIAVKGSPMEVLASCHLSDSETAAIAAENEAMARRGLRVLAFACAEADACSPDVEAGGLEWLGLVGLADPLRPGAAQFLAHLRSDGLDCVMLTGDQAPTACTVAYELQMIDRDDCAVADAAMVEALGADELAEAARQTRIFARIQPRHKLKVVQAFRTGGRVVAMVGDGINDGPALKAADIGITMGRRGSGAARDLSDLVLENDDLAGLADAVEQGRLTHTNIHKSVHFLIATNLSEMLLMTAATGLGISGALNPLQLLWINLATDVFPGLALAREPADAGEIRHAPQGRAETFLEGPETARIAGSAGVMASSALAAFTWARATGGDALRASSLATTSLVTSQMLYAYTSRSRRRWGGGPNRSLDLAVGATFAAHLTMQAMPGARRILGLGPLGVADLAVAAASGLASYLINEARKPARRSNKTGQQ